MGIKDIKHNLSVGDWKIGGTQPIKDRLKLKQVFEFDD
jgi:hypothetical protein